MASRSKSCLLLSRQRMLKSNFDFRVANNLQRNLCVQSMIPNPVTEVCRQQSYQCWYHFIFALLLISLQSSLLWITCTGWKGWKQTFDDRFKAKTGDRSNLNSFLELIDQITFSRSINAFLMPGRRVARSIYSWSVRCKESRGNRTQE